MLLIYTVSHSDPGLMWHQIIWKRDESLGLELKLPLVMTFYSLDCTCTHVHPVQSYSKQGRASLLRRFNLVSGTKPEFTERLSA